MPPPPSIFSSFAICLRCQFRYSHRSQLPRRITLPPLRFRSAAFFTTTPLPRTNTPPPREIVILEPPGPRKSLHKYGPPPPALDDSNLNSGIQQLLTFEFEHKNVHDATHMEISLYRPERTRVSKERYQQMFHDLDHAFLRAQVLQYCSRTAPIGGGTLVKPSKKKDILDEILRGRWGIEVTDEIAEREDVVRHKVIESSRRDIFFMVGEDGRVLRRWAERYSTRITVNVQTSVLQLRGSLANIERIEGEIEAMLKNIITEDIDLSWVSRLQKFNEEFISPIARITNTFIEKLDENTIRVVALGPERDAIEDAFRLLFASLDLQFRSSYSLLYNPPRSQESIGGALYPFTEDPSLTWRFRGRDWARWRDVKTKSPPLEGEPGFVKNPIYRKKMNHERGLDGLRGVRKILDESANREALELEAQQVHPAEYQVILGCLLHDSDGHNITKGRKPLEEFIKEERLRVLCYDFPGVSFIARKPQSRIGSSVDEDGGPKLLDDGSAYSFILKFAPSPWSNRDTFEQFPPLEMTLKVDTFSGKAQDPKLVAVYSESMVDLLMPSQNCDLRFLRRVNVPLSLGISRLDPAGGGVTEKEMARFMNESNLNPAGDDKLRASPQIKVLIPPFMMQLPPSSPTQEIDYIFTGMEFRSELQFDWNGFCMHHTVVEGGISGGRKTEVRLVCKPVPGTGGRQELNKEEEEEEFVGLETDKEAEELKSQMLKFGTLESGMPGVDEIGPEVDSETLQEPENQQSHELGASAAVSDTTFSSFVESTMELVESLEKRLLDSTSRGRGVLRA